jgi:hypothetical protein
MQTNASYITTSFKDTLAADSNGTGRITLYVREEGFNSAHAFLTPDEAVELATRLLTSAREARQVAESERV